MADFDPKGRVYASYYEYDNRELAESTGPAPIDPQMATVIVRGKRSTSNEVILGVNSVYSHAIGIASKRTKIPKSSIAAIINAEAGLIPRTQAKAQANSDL